MQSCDNCQELIDALKPFAEFIARNDSCAMAAACPDSRPVCEDKSGPFLGDFRNAQQTLLRFQEQRSSDSPQEDDDLDEDGYPTDYALHRIQSWPYSDFSGLMDYVCSLWSYPDYIKREGDSLSIATGGWSGNESLISALQKNFPFWALCWVSSRRGGQFEFEIKTVPSSTK